MKRMLSCLVLFLLVYRYKCKQAIINKPIKSNPKRVNNDQDDNPLHVIAQYLYNSRKRTELSKYSFVEIVNALTHLASSQSALKSVDGATHAFRNTLSDR